MRICKATHRITQAFTMLVVYDEAPSKKSVGYLYVFKYGTEIEASRACGKKFMSRLIREIIEDYSSIRLPARSL
jgi:hypothetical protein